MVANVPRVKAIQELERCHFRWLSLPPIHVDTNVCLVAANVGNFRNCDLPGQKCRGLIEVRSPAGLFAYWHNLPRQKCRGLIEAIPVDKNEAARGIIFPGRNAGVSLKLHSLM